MSCFVGCGGMVLILMNRKKIKINTRIINYEYIIKK